MRLVLIASIALSLAGCAPYEEPMPTSAQGWQERQEAIARRENERARLCALARDNDPRKAQLCNDTERAQ
jgi:hypothetical protein